MEDDGRSGVVYVVLVPHKLPRVIILNMIHTHIYRVINVLLNQPEKKLLCQLRESAPERRRWLTRGLTQPTMHDFSMTEYVQYSYYIYKSSWN
jgi:hypothetical protein